MAAFVYEEDRRGPDYEAWARRGAEAGWGEVAEYRVGACKNA